MIHYDDRGGNYDFNSKSCNLFPRFVFLFFFFLTRVEIVLRIFDAIFFVSTLLHFIIEWNTCEISDKIFWKTMCEVIVKIIDTRVPFFFFYLTESFENFRFETFQRNKSVIRNDSNHLTRKIQ